MTTRGSINHDAAAATATASPTMELYSTINSTVAGRNELMVDAQWTGITLLRKSIKYQA